MNIPQQVADDMQGHALIFRRTCSIMHSDSKLYFQEKQHV